MNILDKIKSFTYKVLGLKKLPGTPNNDRLTFINDDLKIQIAKWREFKVWYYGDASEKLNFYTGKTTFGYMDNPIYNRNDVNMFWSKSSQECNIKRMSTNIARSIVDTIAAIVGKPTIESDYPLLTNIFEKNDFAYKLVNQLRPMALVEGDGCIKINVNPNLADVPLFEYYEAEDWEPIMKSGLMLGMIFKTYYNDEKGNNYVLFETRLLVADGMRLEYELYELGKNNDLYAVSQDKWLPELDSIPREPMLIPVRRLFARPLMYYYNPLRPERGKSIYDGIIELLDMLDEVWSQASQTNRVSTPVEYYNVDILQRTKKGQPVLPKLYNRQFVEGPGQTNADGISENKGIETTQPDLNFDKYGSLASDIVNQILIGRLSPSSLGINIAKDDNAMAQREKEKQTLFTRGNIIDRETKFLKDICEDAAIMQNYINTGLVEDIKLQVSVKYDEFANPSFEQELETLGPAWSRGEISTDQYVKLLWSGKLSPEEMKTEKEWLDNNKESDNIDLEGMMNGSGNNPDLPAKGRPEGQVTETEE